MILSSTHIDIPKLPPQYEAYMSQKNSIGIPPPHHFLLKQGSFLFWMQHPLMTFSDLNVLDASGGPNGCAFSDLDAIPPPATDPDSDSEDAEYNDLVQMVETCSACHGSFSAVAFAARARVGRRCRNSLRFAVWEFSLVSAWWSACCLSGSAGKSSDQKRTTTTNVATRSANCWRKRTEGR